MSKVTDEELIGLSEEEQAALAEDDADEEEEVESAPLTDEAEQASETYQETVQETVIEPFTPVYQPAPVDDFDAKLAALADRKKDLRQQYMDNDIELDEYEERREAVETEVLNLREANLKASMAAEQAQQAAAQRWEWEQERFFGQKANAIYKQDAILGSALDTAIKSLASDQANEHKPMAWFLEEADRVTRERMRAMVGAPTPKESAPIRTKTRLPPNLGDMPAADLNEVNGNEWAHLDKLNGMALEAALAKMSPAEQDRYLRN